MGTQNPGLCCQTPAWPWRIGSPHPDLAGAYCPRPPARRVGGADHGVAVDRDPVLFQPVVDVGVVAHLPALRQQHQHRPACPDISPQHLELRLLVLFARAAEHQDLRAL
eukprot:914870-Pelagomonas_calceolata.AAC.3